MRCCAALHEGVALLRELHAQQVPVFGLTNWSAETFLCAGQSRLPATVR
jgi:hypothetical protein